ncbi:hypothetical protein NDU88_008499 [Pleurodeles waltl]|uniref:Uncharacterized protein n=1 Tax=Pleurodeles waltl TaxID=8319 RepID=A0AAV7N593_PLEWA|nr:hypothetical protein NDU88_008499 [Pleurodeles waltl]
MQGCRDAASSSAAHSPLCSQDHSSVCSGMQGCRQQQRRPLTCVQSRSQQCLRSDAAAAPLPTHLCAAKITAASAQGCSDTGSSSAAHSPLCSQDHSSVCAGMQAAAAPPTHLCTAKITAASAQGCRQQQRRTLTCVLPRSQQCLLRDAGMQAAAAPPTHLCAAKITAASAQGCRQQRSSLTCVLPRSQQRLGRLAGSSVKAGNARR